MSNKIKKLDYTTTQEIWDNLVLAMGIFRKDNEVRALNEVEQQAWIDMLRAKEVIKKNE